MSNPAVRIEIADSALSLTFNRPQSLNALTTPMLHAAAEAVEAAAADTAVRVVAITGEGRAFSSGADLAGEDGKPPGVDTIDGANRLVRAMRAIPKPVVAAVNGPAVGVGCSLAMAADLTLARESAYFLLAFANVGLMPDGGATALVHAAIGRARATRMAMLAQRITAAQAVEWGMIAEAVADDEFPAAVEKLVGKLANGPTVAYGATKRALNAATLAHLEQALELEREGQAALFETEDFAEGMRAFLDERKPRFTAK